MMIDENFLREKAALVKAALEALGARNIVMPTEPANLVEHWLWAVNGGSESLGCVLDKSVVLPIFKKHFGIVADSRLVKLGPAGAVSLYAPKRYRGGQGDWIRNEEGRIIHYERKLSPDEIDQLYRNALLVEYPTPEEYKPKL